MTGPSPAPGSKTLSFQALIKTNARRSEVVLDESLVSISVKARPVDGHADKEAIKLIARALGVPQTSVELVRGLRSRRKYFRVTGLESAPEELKARVEKGR